MTNDFIVVARPVESSGCRGTRFVGDTLETRILAHRIVSGVNGEKYQPTGVRVHRTFQQGEGGVFVAQT